MEADPFTTDVEVSDVTLSKEIVLADYSLAVQSRQASIAGRREVMGGKAKFGIFGDGKEVAQLAMAHAFKPGDFRSGYYRSQTFMLAIGQTTLEEFFAQLYAHADVEAEPATGGRAMNAHFATRLLDDEGRWRNLTELRNSSADVSPTGSQMPRLVGLGYASRLYRELEELKQFTQFSHDGSEIAFGEIGNASAAEGMFWESVNAIGVLQGPVILSIYDDTYGISVPNEYQMVKGDLTELLKGFQHNPETTQGFDVYRVRGWDYPTLMKAYTEASECTRHTHIPVIVHIVEMTQPQGHSTSGSHERYKTKERLAWEAEHDCIYLFRKWILKQGLASATELDAIEAEASRTVEAAQQRAWQNYMNPILQERRVLLSLLEGWMNTSIQGLALKPIYDKLANLPNPLRRDLMAASREALLAVREEGNPARDSLVDWKAARQEEGKERYGSFLYSQSSESPLKIQSVAPRYEENSPQVQGFDVINACFDAALQRDPRVIIFGEDVGKLGDVNQGTKGLQEKYGELRVTDTGIRETTIIGQAIGMALRGLRPIAEIQYLDYLLYCLQIMSDDLATLHWRTHGGQKAPVIVRTRGHRLEGIWHSGSPMGGILHLLHGMHILVPRNMTQAAGFYNTLLLGDDPALIIEVLNGYRIRERLPANIGEFTVPLGVPEVIRQGSDVTLVTYGACCRIAMDAAANLAKVGIEAEVIDVQTLLPFDLHGMILESLKKTSRVVFIDEDVPGGGTGYMLQQVLEVQGGYQWLDSAPLTISGTEHRPAYGSDGDYWSKPNVETIFEGVYKLLNEADPEKYPLFF